jgi:lysophospholipase L1-like esterase
MKSRTILTNLALVVVSVVILFLLGEWVLRLTGRTPLVINPEQILFWHYHPQLGWAHKPGTEGVFEKAQFRTFVRINRKGLRDREHAYERSGDDKRILVLGDSFAWGFGVEQTERFSEYLEAFMGAEVINAGVSGYSTDQELLWFRSEGLRYQPDLVIVLMSGNDAGDNHKLRNYMIYGKPRFILEGDRLELTGVPVSGVRPQYKIVYHLAQHSALLNTVLAVRREMRARLRSADTGETPYALTRALLREIENVASQNGARFMIATTKVFWPRRDGYENFVDVLRSDGFSVLDVEDQFDHETMIIPDDGHWNRVGHEFVARRIEEHIESNKLLGTP